MNRERHKFWESYLHDLQKRMLLGHWKLILWRKRPSGADENAAAGVVCQGSGHQAFIFLNEEFDAATRTEQREVIVHELVHLHLFPMRDHLHKQFGDWTDAWPVLRDAHLSHEEYAVDDLARIIAPSLPLPPKVKP
jgi:hypothetical protein